MASLEQTALDKALRAASGGFWGRGLWPHPCSSGPLPANLALPASQPIVPVHVVKYSGAFIWVTVLTWKQQCYILTCVP